jgi:hypothetical protein
VQDSPTPIKRAYTSKTEEQYLAEMKSNGKKTSSDNIGQIFLLKGQIHENKPFLDHE